MLGWSAVSRLEGKHILTAVIANLEDACLGRFQPVPVRQNLLHFECDQHGHLQLCEHRRHALRTPSCRARTNLQATGLSYLCGTLHGGCALWDDRHHRRIWVCWKEKIIARRFDLQWFLFLDKDISDTPHRLPVLTEGTTYPLRTDSISALITFWRYFTAARSSLVLGDRVQDTRHVCHLVKEGLFLPAQQTHLDHKF